MSEKKIVKGGAVKAKANGIVEGYLIAFTDETAKDLDGEWFSKSTNLHLEDFPIEGAPVLYNHGLSEVEFKSLGKVIKAKIDDIGLWVQAQLDLREDYEKAIYELAKAGKLGWSSGAIAQSVDVDGKSGLIKSWVAYEASLTPTPAQPSLTQITAKSKLLAEVAEDATPASDEAKTTSNVQSTVKDKKQMNKEQIMALLDEIMALLSEDESMMTASESDLEQVKTEAEKSVTRLNPEIVTRDIIREEIIKSVNGLMAKRDEEKRKISEALKASAPARPSKSSQFTPHNQVDEKGAGNWQDRVTVGDNLKYAGASVSDLAFGAMLGKSSDVEWMRQLVGKAEDISNDMNTPYKKRLEIKSMLPIKANEIDGTGNSGFGSNWVATMWTSDVWQVARYDTHYDRFVSKGMQVRQLNNAGTVTFPTEGADPTAYLRAEAADVDAVSRPETTVTISPFGTGSVSISPKEIALATSLTDRLVEDSSVDAFAQANYQVSVKIQETRDQLLINGDTATGATTNINDIAGTPAGTEYWLGANGYRKYALVTATAYSADAGAALTEATWNTAVATLPAKLRWRKANTLLVCDPDTHQASLMLPEMKEYMNTTNTGDLSVFQGHDIVPSGFLALSNAAGKIDLDTAANNTKGTILALYLPYWGVGYSRQITIESDRDILSGTTTIVASFRMGIANLGGGASVAVYNVGV